MTETVHFLGGSPLNRLSWLRTSTKFMNMAALEVPDARWTLFQSGKPLVSRGVDGGPKSFAVLKAAQIKHLLGEEPLFGQGEKTGELVSSEGSVVESNRVRGPPIVFLGVHEPEGVQALPSSEFRTPETSKDISGVPYFSVELSGVPEDVIEELLKSAAPEGQTLKFDDPRSASATFSMFDAAVFAEARSMLDWIIRNKFCAACGSPTYSLWGGWKLSCTSLLPWANNEGREPCPSGTGLHNFTHPRTDPVIITLVIDETGDRILLGRNRKFPGNFFSTLAGFCEPAESFEDAVKREIWEESGIRVYDVRYHSSQPWPYPANLMVGCYASADSSQAIRIDLDNELAEARWFTREEVAAVLNNAQGTIINIRRPELDKPAKDIPEFKPEGGPQDAPAFRVPPRTAIAGVLISDWVAGKIGNKGGTAHIKGNL
ncbi:hypothetical protein M422DRAFT_216569 [Sphaerobolus stellatus SS14]|uniref:NAD(+) diphosphatase n=1 Tax=Sphaerobolus stellatus (strain SS14) TaxID=990650 RepID=A0A0C9T9K5_SPHS4|nr:hypothetical protein M422DRAFT_216569 [Sphaerobolus stellatus SS14]